MNIYSIKMIITQPQNYDQVQLFCWVCNSNSYDNNGIDDNIVDDIKNFPQYDDHANWYHGIMIILKYCPTLAWYTPKYVS